MQQAPGSSAVRLQDMIMFSSFRTSLALLAIFSLAASLMVVAPPSAGAQTSVRAAGGLDDWELVLSETFDRDAREGEFSATYPTIEHYPAPWRDTSGNGQYSDAYVSVRDGVLRKRLHTSGGTHHVAALAPKVPGSPGFLQGQTYGRYSVRFRVPAPIPGYKVAWLLWPDSDDWNEGEINFPEADLRDGANVHAFNHLIGNPRINAYALDTRQPMVHGAWREAVIEWSPDSIRYLIDGQEVGRTSESVPSTAMHWVLQTETQLSGGPPSNDVSGVIEIDSVAIWRYAPGYRSAEQIERSPTNGGTNDPDTPADSPMMFSDVSPGNTHADAIRELTARGVVIGDAQGRFRPADFMTRGQLASMLAKSSGLTSSASSDFPDTTGSAHENEIVALTQAGIISGYPDGTFRPDRPITRGQVATMLARWLEVEPATGQRFDDTSTSVHRHHIEALAEIGVVRGITPSEFAPRASLRRDQGASLLLRGLEWRG
jgi:hypothetical protein